MARSVVAETLALEDFRGVLVDPPHPGCGLRGVGDDQVVLTLPTGCQRLERSPQCRVVVESLPKFLDQDELGRGATSRPDISTAMASSTRKIGRSSAISSGQACDRLM